MKKTIVVTPEKTETYTEMVPVQKTRIIPAVTQVVTVDEGPGYLKAWLNGQNQWSDNRDGAAKNSGVLLQSPDAQYLKDALSPRHPRGLFWVQPGQTVEQALAIINGKGV